MFSRGATIENLRSRFAPDRSEPAAAEVRGSLIQVTGTTGDCFSPSMTDNYAQFMLAHIDHAYSAISTRVYDVFQNWQNDIEYEGTA